MEIASATLHYNYFRDYDAAVGRYVESDPIGLEGGINPYRYGGANPLRSIDPYGLDFFDPVWGLIYQGTGGWSPSQNLVDRAAGFGDGLVKGMSLGFGDLAETRRALGIDGGVDECSSSYRNWQVGGKVWGGATLWTMGLYGGPNATFFAGAGARELAMLEGNTIIRTPWGAILNTIAPNFRPVWQLASATYAANAKNAIAIIRYVAPTSIWRIESTILQLRGVSITYF